MILKVFFPNSICYLESITNDIYQKISHKTLNHFYAFLADDIYEQHLVSHAYNLFIFNTQIQRTSKGIGSIFMEFKHHFGTVT